MQGWPEGSVAAAQPFSFDEVIALARAGTPFLSAHEALPAQLGVEAGLLSCGFHMHVIRADGHPRLSPLGRAGADRDVEVPLDERTGPTPRAAPLCCSYRVR